MRSPFRSLFILGAALITLGANSGGHLHAAGPLDIAPSPSPYEIQYVLANTEFTLLHELAHALFTEFDMPVMGNEEEAADRFAALALLASREDRAGGSLQRVESVATELGIEAADDPVVYEDSHPPAIKRFYDLLCLAFGSDPGKFGNYVKDRLLPLGRAMYCRTEYKQTSRAVSWMRRQRAQLPLKAARGKISISYELPAGSAGEVFLDELKRSELADKAVRHVENNFQLPRDLSVSFRNCHEDAFWNSRSGTVVLCYDLLEDYWRHAKKSERTNDPLTEKFTPLNLVMPARIFDSLKEQAGRGGNMNEIAVEALKSYFRNSPEIRDQLPMTVHGELFEPRSEKASPGQ